MSNNIQDAIITANERCKELEKTISRIISILKISIVDEASKGDSPKPESTIDIIIDEIDSLSYKMINNNEYLCRVEKELDKFNSQNNHEGSQKGM